MKDLKYKIILEKFSNYANNINSSIIKEDYIKNLEETKSILDKNYLLAYYDIRFNIPNQNKLLESIRKVQKENQKKRYNLLFLYLEDLNSKYYSEEKNKVVEKLLTIKNKFERSTFFNDGSMVNNELYIFNDCFVFFIKNDKIRKFYKFVKKVMQLQDYFVWKVYFEELIRKQTKPLKSLETCYLKVLQKIKNNQIDEKIQELEQKELNA